MERSLAVTAAISCALSVTGVGLGQACESSSGFSVTQPGDSSLSFPELGFGSAMSGSDQRLAIGYPLQDEANENGTVSFYVPDVASPGSWTFEQTISFPYPANFLPGLAGTGQVGGIQFGRAVALAGPQAIVGVNGSLYATLVGSTVDYFRSTPVVYSLTNGTWVGTQLPSPFPDFSQTPIDLGLAGEFGTVVAIEGDVAVVGEPAWDPDVFPNRRFGRIHVYEQAQGVWTHVQAIPNPTQGEVNERFGQSIAIVGGVIAVGAPGDVRGSNDSGAVYLYESSGGVWSLVGEVLPELLNPNYRFGESVDCQILPDGSFELAVANTREEQELATGVTGSVHLYRGSTASSLSLVSVLDDEQISVREGGDFGASIDLSGELLLIGRSTPSYRLIGIGPGGGFIDPPLANAYVASRSLVTDKWLIGAVLNHPENDGNESAWLGQDVAVADSSLFVADPSAVSSEGDIASGVVFASSAVFAAADDCSGDGFSDACQLALNGAEADCNQNGILDLCEIFADPGLDIDGNGILDECDPDCNCNGIPDGLDIANDTSLDVNPQDGIPDECARANFVFIVDTSNSVSEQALDGVLELRDLLNTDDRVASARVLRIDAIPGFQYDGSVQSIVSPGTPVPVSVPGGSASSCNSTVDTFGNEDWGDAISVIAASYPWTPAARRVIVVLTDEAPCKGGDIAGVWDADDQSALNNAINVVNDNQAEIWMIYEGGMPSDLRDLAAIGPDQTGGRDFVVDPVDGDVPVGGDIPLLAPVFLTEIAANCAECPGDTNGDGAVDLADLNVVLANFGTTGGLQQGDVTGDGQIDLADLNLVLAQFGTQCSVSQSSFSMSMTDPEELPVTIWLMLKDHPNADAWIDQLSQFDPTAQKQDAEALKEWVDDWEAGSPE